MVLNRGCIEHAHTCSLLDHPKEATGSVNKALLQTLIEDVRVTSRNHIEPTIRVPRTPPVRNLSAVVEPAGIEPAS